MHVHAVEILLTVGAWLLVTLIVIGTLRATHDPNEDLLCRAERGEVFLAVPIITGLRCGCLSSAKAKFEVPEGNPPGATPVCLECARAAFTAWALRNVKQRTGSSEDDGAMVKATQGQPDGSI